LDWFDVLVTATSVRLSVRSLPNAIRSASVHAKASESHASFKATTWSISSSDALVTVTRT